MPKLTDLLDAFPEAAVLILQGKISAANPMAQHYLPQLEPGCPVPSYMPLTKTGPAAGTFTAGLSTYSFRLSYTPEGLLFFFSPAPQTALTDAQLDGALRQLRSFLAELLLETDGHFSDNHAVSRKNFYRMFRLADNLDCMHLAATDSLSFRPITMDLAGLCRQTVESAALLLRDGGIFLDYQSTLPSLLIPGDPLLLQRLLLELISNSARAVGSGTVQIQLSLHGSRALLFLSDSGTPLIQRQLAAMLQQDSDQRPPVPQAGAGLGLSIARHISALHGGSLLIEWGQAAPTVILSLPTGPLSTRATVSTPTLHRDGGLSPLLVALSDALPTGVFERDNLD